MSRYDQIEGVDYGQCLDCGIALATADDAASHRQETMSPGVSSHRTQGTNRTRAERVQSMVNGEVESAITDALDRLQGEIDDGDVTEEEIVEALAWHSDFLDEWNRS